MPVPDSNSVSSNRPQLPFSRLILAALLLLPLALSTMNTRSITEYYFQSQDRYLILVLVLSLLLLTVAAPRWKLPDVQLRRGPLTLALGALALILWWGTYAVMANYALTRDEHMVLFDMAIFAKGQLLEPFAEAWRGNPKAVVPDFLLDVPGHVAVASGYLPGNAMLRLAFSKIADPALMNPLFVVIGGLALFDIARRLFGEDYRAVLVAMLLYLGSAQLLVNAMTVYAMTGHTALNLVWLALFLRGGRLGHVGAIAVGFVATGLHQIAFHPLVVAPFLLWRLAERRYGLVAAYAAAYSAIGIFWVIYQPLAIQMAGIIASGGASDGTGFLRDRVWPLLIERDPFTLVWMAFNLIRFAVWNHLALIPLLVAAWPLVRGNRGIAAPLAGGIVLTIAVCGLILPMQGHGWGYRYLAAVLGNFALLGAIGYRHWAASDRASADGVVMALSGLTLAFIALTTLGAHRFVAPHARLDRSLGTLSGDTVLIDTERPSMAIDIVRNRPDLANRPLRVSSRALAVSEIARLCAQGSVELVMRREMFDAGFPRMTPERSPAFEAKVAKALAGKPCLRQVAKR